ncbi:methylamine utilization protein [Novosphingobium sp.]|uniref:methylamine utilization protein n=1 Tax=Novosphingobium sp. TaxID=1874826 RepID=UPI0025FEA316|nr:methylamine utilization protein [Novosphingobium sp.]
MTVVAKGADGRVLSGAVVSITVAGAPRPQPRGTYTMSQQNIAFAPHVLIVPVGATVSFPNRDRVRHHAYSFSPAKRFELKLYGRDETKSVTFDRPGVAAIGCNIHDAMSAFVFVTTTPFVAITDGSGRVVIDGVPPGQVSLALWHPSIRAPNNSVSRPAIVAAGGLATEIAPAR